MPYVKTAVPQKWPPCDHTCSLVNNYVIFFSVHVDPLIVLRLVTLSLVHIAVVFYKQKIDVTNQLLLLKKYTLWSFKSKACLKSEKLWGSFKIFNQILTNVSFSYLWKNEKTFGFQKFSGGIKRKHYEEMG